MENNFSNRQCRDIEILVVEDNYAEVRLIEEYFKDERMIPHTLHSAKDGIEAMKFLEKTDKYENAPRPDVILLDLNMPRMDGREVLQKVRNDERFKDIVVCLMTGTAEEAEELGANIIPATFYILKPVDVDKFINMVKRATTYLPEELKNLIC